MTSDKENYYVGELAKSYNVTRDTIRLYDKKGLLSPKKSPKNQYRCYSIKDLACLNYIMMLKKVGLSLPTINEIVNEYSIEESHHTLHDQITEIDNKIAELTRLRATVCDYEQTFERSIQQLDVINICKSPVILYKELGKSLSDTLNAFLDISTAVHPRFTYILGADDFNNDDFEEKISNATSRKSISTVALSALSDLGDIDLPKTNDLGFKAFMYDKCINVVVRCYTDNDYSGLVNVKKYMSANGYKACGPVISRLLFIINNNNESKDYYDLWIPIESTEKESIK